MTEPIFTNEVQARYADPADLARRTISRIDEAIPAAAAPAEPTKAQMIAAARAKSAARRFDFLMTL